jgi:hypothetical protein
MGIRHSANRTTDFVRLLPKDVLLHLAEAYLTGREAAALGRTAWTHMKAMHTYRIKRPLHFEQLLTVLATADSEQRLKEAGRPTAPALIHPGSHLQPPEEAPHETILARESGYPSMFCLPCAIRVRTAADHARPTDA